MIIFIVGPNLSLGHDLLQCNVYHMVVALMYIFYLFIMKICTTRYTNKKKRCEKK